MAAGPAIEMWSRQGGNVDTQNGKVKNVTFRRAFTMTLAADDAVDVAFQAAGLPQPNQPYPGTLFVVAKKFSPSRIAPTLAVVEIDYQGEIGPGGPSSSPVDTEVILSWRSSVTDEAIDEDIFGKPIVTKNNEPIDGITERIPNQIATIQRNFLSINVHALSAYLRSVNADPFLGFPAGTGRFMDYSATNVITNGVAGFWKVSATFEFREPYRTTPLKCWHKRIRHEGYLVRSAPGEDPQDWYNSKTKATLTRPVLLKEDGTEQTDPDAAFWLEFQTLAELPYGALGLI